MPHSDIIRPALEVFRADASAVPGLTLRGGAALDRYHGPPAYDPTIDEPSDAYLEEYAFNGLPYLDAASWRHYLPRLMDYALRHLGRSRTMAIEGLLSSLRPPDREPPRLATLSAEQETVIVSFLEHLGLPTTRSPGRTWRCRCSRSGGFRTRGTGAGLGRTPDRRSGRLSRRTAAGAVSGYNGRPGGPMEPDTRLVHAGRDPERNFGIVNPPVYRASTILYPTLAEFENRHHRKFGGFAYGLHGTPTTLALAEAVAELSGGAATIVASSGLAAVTQTLAALLRQGDHLLIADTVYGPTREFCTTVLARFGVDVTFYDPLLGASIAGLLRDRTRVVYLESPGSLTFEVQDVPAIAGAAHAGGAVVVLDNTWATPLGFRAFEHGADVEVLAGTKHLAGHSDLLLGLITTRTEPLFRAIREGATAFGDCVAPDVCYEGLRGLRTLGVRLRHHARSTLEVARWLKARPEVARVLYPALPDDPGHALWTRDFTLASSLFGVLLRTDSEHAVAAMVEGMRLFRIGASFGGFESLITPARPAAQRTARPWREPGFLLRLHVGLEAVSDLIADLDEGLARLDAALRTA